LAHVFLVHKIIERGRHFGSAQDHVEYGLVAIRQEDGAGLAAQRADVLYAVALLVLAGELVALDGAVFVLVYGTYGDQAGLHATIHLELVDVVAAVWVAHVDAGVDAVLHELGGSLVDLRRVHVLVRGELRLRTVDIEERQRAVGYVVGGLFAVEDVVGKRGRLSGVLRQGSYAGKGQCLHGGSSLLVALCRFLIVRAARRARTRR